MIVVYIFNNFLAVPSFFLLLHIDDIPITSKDKSLFNKFKSQLGDEFEMKDLSVAKKILGEEI